MRNSFFYTVLLTVFFGGFYSIFLFADDQGKEYQISFYDNVSNSDLGCNSRSQSKVISGGWVEFGVFANSHGTKGYTDGIGNGPMHTAGNRRTDFHLDQLYLFTEREMDTKRGFDYGYRVDLVYGVDANGMQSYGDDSFDSGWGVNHHGYALSMYQLYATIGYKDLHVKLGKFITPIGWEASASLHNFFYSHSYCYWIEPSTHTGVWADYHVSDRLTVSAAWTTGNENGFKNHYDDIGFLGGVKYKLSEKASVYYWMTVGKTKNKFRLGDWRFEDDGALDRQNYFVQSLCFEWMPTDRWTYVFQYNLRNDSNVEAGNFQRSKRYSSYGINNHLLYKINDRWSVGMRLEWLRDNGGNERMYYVTEKDANYFQTTFGIVYTPSKCWSIRPEIRYDSVLDGSARPFKDGRSREQFSGGIGMLYIF